MTQEDNFQTSLNVLIDVISAELESIENIFQMKAGTMKKFLLDNNIQSYMFNINGIPPEVSGGIYERSPEL